MEGERGEFLIKGIMNIKSSFLWTMSVILFTLGCATGGDVTRLRNDVLGLEKKYEEAIPEIRKNQAEIGVKIDTLQVDLQVLTGRFEEGRYQTERSLKDVTTTKENYSLQIKELENRLNNLKDRLSAIEHSLNIQPASSPETKQPPPEVKEGEKKSPGDIYKEAYATFKHGEIAVAREMFKRFLKTYPKGEFSDNALYWLGECYYAEKNYEDAILSFEDLIKKFPKSDKVPRAMLKQGYSFYELGDKASGKLLMERVIEKFPKSEEASLAKKRLKGVSKPTQKKK